MYQHSFFQITNNESEDRIEVPFLSVSVEPLDQSCGKLRMDDNGPEIWNWCVSNQFPISKTISKSDNRIILGVGDPHGGYTIHAQMKGGKMDGDATIQAPNNAVIAKIRYSQGNMTGPCKLYYPSGNILLRIPLRTAIDMEKERSTMNKGM